MNTYKENQEEFVSIEVITKDRKGLVYEITGIISELNIAILNHKARVYNNKNKGMVSDFKVVVKAESHRHIETLIHRLNKIKGVISVNR
ncbi:MAG: hypothetical protein K2K89_12185 [Ruminococcus sp.]|nr:hypothetical protein [Ruminococcus sp.]MDE6426873.1 hypothetical protein [Ruminococcus sp.]MDE6500839.1 hypothetical protein [Ruminococcus sp.]